MTFIELNKELNHTFKSPGDCRRIKNKACFLLRDRLVNFPHPDFETLTEERDFLKRLSAKIVPENTSDQLYALLHEDCRQLEVDVRNQDRDVEKYINWYCCDSVNSMPVNRLELLNIADDLKQKSKCISEQAIDIIISNKDLFGLDRYSMLRNTAIEILDSCSKVHERMQVVEERLSKEGLYDAAIERNSRLYRIHQVESTVKRKASLAANVIRKKVAQDIGEASVLANHPMQAFAAIKRKPVKAVIVAGGAFSLAHFGGVLSRCIELISYYLLYVSNQKK